MLGSVTKIRNKLTSTEIEKRISNGGSVSVVMQRKGATKQNIANMPLPEGYFVRRVDEDDYEGVVDTLKVLTTVGQVSKEQFASVVQYWDSVKLHNCSQGGGTGLKYNPLVIVETVTGEVAATGNIIIEQKLIHDCGLVGHVEDISVSEKHQGKKLGKCLIEQLTDIGMENGCYKIILDCDPKNIKFYEKCGYNEAGVEMNIRANL